MDSFGSKRIAIKDNVSYGKTIEQVQQTKEENIILWRRRRKLGEGILNKNPMGESQVQGDNGLSLAELKG